MTLTLPSLPPQDAALRPRHDLRALLGLRAPRADALGDAAQTEAARLDAASSDTAGAIAGGHTAGPAPAPRGVLPMFARDFAGPDPQAAQSLANAVQHAEAAGYARGVADAQAEAQAQAAEREAASLAAALGQIAAALPGLRGAAQAEAARRADGLSRLVLGVIAAALPHWWRQHAQTEVQAGITQALRSVPQGGVRIAVAPGLRAGIAAALAPHSNAGLITAVIEDATLAAADFRLAWEDGEALRSTEAVQAALRAALHDAGLGLPEPAATQADPSAKEPAA